MLQCGSPARPKRSGRERLIAQGSGLLCDTCRTPAASSEPNVIVDGMANYRTLITLSHWRRSGTPADLMADTSTAIVFNYLDRPDLHVPADVVSNKPTSTRTGSSASTRCWRKQVPGQGQRMANVIRAARRLLHTPKVTGPGGPSAVGEQAQVFAAADASGAPGGAPRSGGREYS